MTIAPRQAEAASRVTRALVDAMAHGYARVSPPLAEFAKRWLSAAMTDPHRRDLLRFTDPVSQRTLALRPDTSPGRSAALPRPATGRAAAAASLLRRTGGESSATSRIRRARCCRSAPKLIGSDSVAAARESSASRLTGSKLRGSVLSRSISPCRTLVDLLANGPLPVEDGRRSAAVRGELDAKEPRADPDAAPRLICRCCAPPGRSIATDARLAAHDRRRFSARIDALEAIAAPVRDRVTLTLDPTERHGFAYQSWFGFQIFVPGQGDAVGRGGGYAIPVGEQEEAAVGFSLYPDRPDRRRACAQDDTPPYSCPPRVWLWPASPLRAVIGRRWLALSDAGDARTLELWVAAWADGPDALKEGRPGSLLRAKIRAAAGVTQPGIATSPDADRDG
ncbi:ATP phosphoribosyltransferase regulatory subunit [Novosphingobium sp.]|uniref:ATP phosphoribosyltransferase regulatory subunit n=1 Tax=Novosphingobium sp. TaxID=1874826 RepID=UPI0025DA9534|nr:ATP phosphoribosyltransferase regulatory subunit [Novosphingobium sp.]